MKLQIRETPALCLLVALAAALWYFTFAVEIGNFWLKISFSAALLAGLAMLYSWSALKPQFHSTWPQVFIGFCSAIGLYGIFWLGNWFLTTLFESSRSSIQSVYASKGDLPAWSVGLLLLGVTSPAEEIFWRGFVQRICMQKFSSFTGFVLAACCYTGVHLCTLNFPLVLAAFVAGVFWGFLYLSQKSLVPVIVSHACWSILVFLIFPFS